MMDSHKKSFKVNKQYLVNANRYDYGSAAENIERYGARSPPHFELGRLRVPTALFSGSHDALASPADVRRLERKLRPTGIQ